MFGWLFRRKDPAVFTYWNGSRHVLGDAMQIMRGLMLHEAADYDLEHDCKLAGLPTEDPRVARDVMRAIGRLADAVRSAFKVKQMDEGGLDDERCLRLLLDFMKWKDSQKKTTNTSPTSAQLTPATSDVLPLQPRLSDSGSTEDEAKPEESQPLPVG